MFNLLFLPAFHESLIRLGAVWCFVDRVDIPDMATAGSAHDAARVTSLCAGEPAELAFARAD